MNNVTQPPGAIRAAFCRGVSGKSARTRRLKSCDCYSFDGNGNVAALASAANGNVTAQYGYGPFGEAIRSTGPMAKANPIRFSTKCQDDESDLLYYGYRCYKPSTGSWLSRDPSEEDGGLNVYAFSANNSVWVPRRL
jgi:RHS repeat-associated protein